MVGEQHTEVDELGDAIFTKTVVPDFGMYSPYYQGQFDVAKRFETPLLNGLRLRLGLDSAENHTVIVPRNGYVGSVRTTDADRRDDTGAQAAVSNLQSMGYEVIDEADALERYGTDVESHRLQRRLRKRRAARERYENLSEREQCVYDCVCDESVHTAARAAERCDMEQYEVESVLHLLEADGVLDCDVDTITNNEQYNSVFDDGSLTVGPNRNV